MSPRVAQEPPWKARRKQLLKYRFFEIQLPFDILINYTITFRQVRLGDLHLLDLSSPSPLWLSLSFDLSLGINEILQNDGYGIPLLNELIYIVASPTKGRTSKIFQDPKILPTYPGWGNENCETSSHLTAMKAQLQRFGSIVWKQVYLCSTCLKNSLYRRKFDERTNMQFWCFS